MGLKLFQQDLGCQIIPMAVNQSAASTQASCYTKRSRYRSSTHGDMGGSLMDSLFRRELRDKPEMIERGCAYADNLHR